MNTLVRRRTGRSMNDLGRRVSLRWLACGTAELALVAGFSGAARADGTPPGRGWGCPSQARVLFRRAPPPQARLPRPRGRASAGWGADLTVNSRGPVRVTPSSTPRWVCSWSVPVAGCSCSGAAERSPVPTDQVGATVCRNPRVSARSGRAVEGRPAGCGALCPLNGGGASPSPGAVAACEVSRVAPPREATYVYSRRTTLTGWMDSGTAYRERTAVEPPGTRAVHPFRVRATPRRPAELQEHHD